MVKPVSTTKVASGNRWSSWHQLLMPLCYRWSCCNWLSMFSGNQRTSCHRLARRPRAPITITNIDVAEVSWWWSMWANVTYIPWKTFHRHQLVSKFPAPNIPILLLLYFKRTSLSNPNQIDSFVAHNTILQCANCVIRKPNHQDYIFNDVISYVIILCH
jgi:hypothetical protein